MATKDEIKDALYRSYDTLPDLPDSPIFAAFISILREMSETERKPYIQHSLAVIGQRIKHLEKLEGDETNVKENSD